MMSRIYIGKQSGVALLIVLWMMTLLTLIAATYSTTMRTETVLTAHQIHAAQSRALAEAGIWLALQELLRPKIERTWQTDGSQQTLEYERGKVRVSIQDEAGKIDLNTARAELLQTLLQSTDMEQENITPLLHAILDWRDRDNLRRDSGAEDDEYRALDLDYRAKDGPFNSVNELRLVLGMNESIFQQIRSTLTVYSHQPGINPELASRAVLLAVPDITPDSVEEILSNRINNAETNGRSSDVGHVGVNNRYFSRAKDRTFTITSEGMAADSVQRLDVVILVKRNAKPPFSVLSWREAKPAQQPEQSDDN